MLGLQAFLNNITSHRDVVDRSVGSLQEFIRGGGHFADVSTCVRLIAEWECVARSLYPQLPPSPKSYMFQNFLFDVCRIAIPTRQLLSGAGWVRRAALGLSSTHVLCPAVNLLCVASSL